MARLIAELLYDILLKSLVVVFEHLHNHVIVMFVTNQTTRTTEAISMPVDINDTKHIFLIFLVKRLRFHLMSFSLIHQLYLFSLGLKPPYKILDQEEFLLIVTFQECLHGLQLLIKGCRNLWVDCEDSGEEVGQFGEQLHGVWG